MSLGLNPNRPHRMNQLPGSVNTFFMSRSSSAAAYLASRRRSPPPKSLLAARVSSSSTSSYPAAAAAAASAAARDVPAPAPAPAPEPSSSTAESQHWAYATALDDVRRRDDAETVVAEKGSRVMAVYPMESDERGAVYMRLKTVHAVTGQLSYVWAMVYDPDTEKRYIGDFALCPSTLDGPPN